MSVVRGLHQPAYVRQNPLLLLHPDDIEATLIHPCAGCDKLTILPKYCAICTEEIAALADPRSTWPRKFHAPVLIPPRWQPFAIDMVALLVAVAFCWLCCAL